MKIMAFGAHPADPIWWAAGTLAKHSRRGDKVILVSLTCGEHSHADYFWEKELKGEKIPSLQEIKKIKTEEFKDAARVLGVEPMNMDYGDSPLKIDNGRLTALIDIIRENKPDIVLTSWHTDPQNIDHAVTGKTVWQACHHARELGLKTKHPPHKVSYIYYYPPVMGFGPEVGFIPDIYVNISETIDVKIEALSKFLSQKMTRGSAETWVKRRAGAFAERVESDYVEVFKRLWGRPQPYLPG
jgi:4-oxalomesaconate hydratase